MRGGTGSQGYTIVETMIFLAISGFMFVIAAGFISGKQAKAELNTGMNGINSTVQGVINDVANGTYDFQGNFTCHSTASAGGFGNLTFSSGSTPQGTNGGLDMKGCVFFGKVIQFADNGDASKYMVYTVAGSQYANGGNGPETPTSFASAEPTVVDSSVTGFAAANLTAPGTLQSGLTVTKMYGSTCSNLKAVGFFSSFSNYSMTGTGTAQTVNVVPFCASSGSLLTESNAATIAKIDRGGSYPAVSPDVHIVVCFDGGKQNYGSLTIGGQNSQRLTTSIQVSNSPTALGC